MNMSMMKKTYLIIIHYDKLTINYFVSIFINQFKPISFNPKFSDMIYLVLSA